jgi:hypothetical protein
MFCVCDPGAGKRGPLSGGLGVSMVRSSLNSLAQKPIKGFDGFHTRVFDMAVSDVLDGSVGNLCRGGYLDPLAFKGMQPSQYAAQGLTV